MAPGSSAAKVAAACAVGLPNCVTINASCRGDPVIVLIDPARRSQAILDLAQHFADAHGIQTALASESSGADNMSADTLVACLESTGVSASQGIERWQEKCRESFGAGFQVSHAELAEMGECEARVLASGRPSPLTPGLAELFSAPM